jgi:hypothetical protein
MASKADGERADTALTGLFIDGGGENSLADEVSSDAEHPARIRSTAPRKATRRNSVAKQEYGRMSLIRCPKSRFIILAIRDEKVKKFSRPATAGGQGDG